MKTADYIKTMLPVYWSDGIGSVIFNMGYSNGIQKITSVSAKKDNITFTATSLTKLLKQLN